MAIKSPQEMQKVGVGQQGSVRFQGAQAIQTDPSFLNTYQNFASARERQDAENAKYVTKNFDNQAEAIRQQAQGNLAMSEGVNALEEHKKQKKLLVDSYQKLVDKSPEEFKPLLQQRANEHVNRYGAFSIPYMAGQVNKIREETDKQYLANTMRNAMEMSAFEDYLAVDAKVNVEMAAEDAARRKYGDSPLLVENAKRVAVSEMYLGALQTQATYGDMKKAENILAKFSEDMTPEDRMKAVKALKTARDDQATREALDTAEMAITQFPDDFVKQEEFIATTAKDSKDYNDKMNILKTKNKSVELQKKKDLENVLVKANEEYAKTGKVSDALIMQIPADKRSDQLTKISNNRGSSAVTNWSLHSELMDAVILGDPERVREINLKAYAHEINPQDMRGLESRRDAKLMELSKDRSAAQRSSIKDADDIIRTLAPQFGIKTDKFHQAEFGKFREIGLVEWERMKDGPPMTIKEMRARIYGAYKSRGVTEVEGPREFSNLWGLRDRGTVPQVMETLKPDLNSPLVAPYRNQFRKAYIQKLKSEGKPLPPQEELLKIEDYMMEKFINEGKIKLK
jgi:hypothetical protein